MPTTNKALLQEILDEQKRISKEMSDAINNSSDGLTAWEVASQIHWNVGTWEEIGFWTRRMATTETLSHLEYMHEKNILNK